MTIEVLDPTELIRRALKNSPRASQAEIRETVLGNLTDLHRLRVFDYWFANMFRSFAVEIKKDSTVVRDKIRHIRDRSVKTRKAAVEKLKFALMDHMLSSGKLLREATFAECIRESGWLADVGKQGDPNAVVGKHLTETDLMNIRLRNSKGSLKIVRAA